MPYLPSPTTETVVFPLVNQKDFALQVRMIEDKWRRFYPWINYYPILKAVTVDTDVNGASVVGEPGTTIFDPVYGESVDPLMLVDGWQQPHLSGTYRAFDTDVFADPVQINARVLLTATDTELHHYGFDRVLDLMLEIPASLFDSVSVTAQAGDKFLWGEGHGSTGGEYTVIELGPNNRYLNAATMLYVGLNCKSRRKGS